MLWKSSTIPVHRVIEINSEKPPMTKCACELYTMHAGLTLLMSKHGSGWKADHATEVAGATGLLLRCWGLDDAL